MGSVGLSGLKKLLLISGTIFVFFTANGQLTGNGVVINEIMAQNNAYVTDEKGQYEDWIELYNTNDFEVDLSGFYLSDKGTDAAKWKIPQGTVIPANGYLVIWADDDVLDGPLHAAFKLSATGEEVVFSDASLNRLDYVAFGPQTVNLGYARIPNGTGNFVIQLPSIGEDNESVLAVSMLKDINYKVYPNPAAEKLTFEFSQDAVGESVALYNSLGKLTAEFSVSSPMMIVPVDHLDNGNYFIQYQSQTQKLIILK